MATVKYSPYKGVFTEGDVITATLDWFDEAEELYFVWAFGLGVYEPMDYKTAVDAGVVTVSGRTVTLKRLVKDEEDARKVFVFRRSLLKTVAEQTSLDAIPLAAMLAELEELRRCAEDAKVEAEKALRVPEDDQDTTHFTDRETRAGQIAGFDDRGNPAVGKGVRQIQEIYELFDKMLALYEEMKETFEAFKKDLAAWENELKAWAEGFRGDMEKLYDETMNAYEDVKAIYEKLKDWERLFEERWESYREELYAEWKTYLNGIRAEWESKLSQIDAKWEEVLSGYDVEWKGVLAAYDAEWKKVLAAYEVEFSELFKKYEALWNENVEAFKAWAEAKKRELLAWEEDLKQWADTFKQELSEWKAAFEQELAAWEEALKKWAEDFQERMEALYEELRQYRYKVVTREEYDALCRAGKIDDGSIYFVKGTFDVGFVFYDLLKEYFPDIIRPIEEGPIEGSEDLRRVAVLDEPNEFSGTTTFSGEVNVLSGKVVRFRNGEGNTAVSIRFTDSPTGGVLNQGSATSTTAMTWMSGNYMSWFSSEFVRLYSGYSSESGISPTAKIEANPNGVILAAGAGDAAKIVIDAGKIQVSGVALTLNVAPTAANHATTKGYVDDKVAALEADYAKFEAGTSTAETGAKHGKSLLASQNGEDGGFYVGANKSATRAWTQNMTRYRQTGVRAYGEKTGKHEDYFWSPRTAEDEPLRVARLKDFAALEAKIAALKERIDALEELPAEGYIRLRIETTSANQSFPLFYQITTEEGGYVSVDWGDGNKETLNGKTTYSPEHTYAVAGEYVVKLTGSKFTAVNGNSGSAYDNFRAAIREVLSLNMPKDSAGVSLRNTFYGCANLTGSIPAWDDCITSASFTYWMCTGLTGNIPAWGANITNADYTYRSCTGLTGNIPAWGANITNAGGTYHSCSGLTGNIPEWGANITGTSYTYNGCRGLTGDIPAWGANITNAIGTYYACAGLTGCSAELLQDPMPSRITSHADCVTGCANAIRQHFTEDWGGTKTGA